MQIEVVFSVHGWVKQTIALNDKGKELGVDKIQEMLNNGSLATTVQEDGTLDITSSGEVVGNITSIDNNLEYEDFEIEEEQEYVDYTPSELDF